VNRTSNGSGIVSELDLSGLQQLDFRSWRAEQVDSPYLAGVAPDRLRADDTKVLTLEVLLGVVADAGRPVKLLIETKHPTRYGGLVEKELVRLLRRFGSSTQTGSGDAQVTVMSFAPVALRRVRLLAPQLPLVLLLDRASPIRRDGSLPTGVDTAGPSIRLLRSDPRYVNRRHALGGRVYCWTVDEPRDVALAAGLGVDAIITNRPAAVRQQLDQLRA
jgi:glycerophosphoryl diester phosphodiesterase